MDFVLDNLKNIRIEDYTYDLPDERIAKFPLTNRDASKLLVYDNGMITEGCFTGVKDVMESGQTLVFNNTKVIHARIFFRRVTGANIEVFCLEPFFPADYAQNFASQHSCDWCCMVGNQRKWKEDELFCDFTYQGESCVLKAKKLKQEGGEVIVRFTWEKAISFSEVLECCGRIPIPPYLNRDSEESDNIRYQTVYSKEEGSVAAPTAGLHFSREVLNDLRDKRVDIKELTLHVGAGTFRPVKAERIGEHDMHTEHLVISRELVVCLRDKVKEIVAVGTTSVRTLESLYWMGVKRLDGMEDFYSVSQWEAYTLPGEYSLQEAMGALVGWFDEAHEELLKARTTIIILPGYRFRVIDAMFTNFHQPQSTLLLLVAAAIGEDWKRVYRHALDHGFRFLSYGDGSLLKVKSLARGRLERGD